MLYAITMGQIKNVIFSHAKNIHAVASPCVWNMLPALLHLVDNYMHCRRLLNCRHLLKAHLFHCGPEVSFETCVAMKFLDDDDD